MDSKPYMTLAFILSKSFLSFRSVGGGGVSGGHRFVAQKRGGGRCDRLREILLGRPASWVLLSVPHFRAFQIRNPNIEA